MNILELNSVTVHRGAGPVISDVSLTVEAGKILALVGPNGAGKTTLLEAISGIVPVASGTLTVNGKDLSAAHRVARSRAGIAHVEQGRTIFPSLTVKENILLTVKHSSRLRDVLEIFPELEKRLESSTALLSGGEQQMVVLARAFAAEPKFLLIDEMSLGLAPVVFTRMLPVIQQLARSGSGVLLVEQFTRLALNIADEALVVASGKVTHQQGPALQLRQDPERLQRAYLGTASPSTA